MQIDYFLNYCKSIIDSSLDWLSDPKQQQESLTKGCKRLPFDILIEAFIKIVNDMWQTPEYKLFCNDYAFIKLKELYNELNEFYDFFPASKEENILNEPQWIQIQKKSQEVKHLLMDFIKRTEKNED